MRTLLAATMIGVGWCAAGAEPFLDRREMPLEFVGPGREVPEPTDVAEVRLGYFGPDDPTHPDGGDLWCAASLAVEEANAQGGYKGKPFRLIARWSDNPWTGGATHVTQMVYTDGVWALIGGIDSASTHVAEQVTTKARLPLLGTASSDRTTNSAVVPWMFSLLPGNQLQAPLLAAEVARRTGREPFVVIAGEDHDSRSFASELNRSLAKRGLVPRFQFVYRATDGNTVDLARHAMESKPAVVLLAADSLGSARLVRDLRAAGFTGPIIGSPSLGRRRFLAEAGPAAEGVILPLLIAPGDKWPALKTAFEKRYQHTPDFAAAATYDAVQLLVAAIRRAGLNRARIGDALRDLSPWPGAAGPVRFDTLGGNTRPISLGQITAGRVVRLDVPNAP